MEKMKIQFKIQKFFQDVRKNKPKFEFFLLHS